MCATLLHAGLLVLGTPSPQEGSQGEELRPIGAPQAAESGVFLPVLLTLH